MIVLTALTLIGFWKRDSIWPAIFNALAEKSLETHDIPRAMAWLDWADVLGSETPETALLRLRAVRRSGDPTKIEAAFEEAQRRSANQRHIDRERTLYAAQSGKLRQSASHLSKLLTDTSGDNKDVCLAYVTGYLRNQRTADALVLIDAWIKDAPTDGYPWLIRAKIRRIQQDLVASEKDLNEALARKPEWPDALVELAELYSESGRAEEAAGLFRRVLASHEQRSRAVVGLAIALKSLGNPEESLSLLQEQLQVDPENADLWLELGRTEFENGNYEAGKKALERAIKIKPWADDARYTLAQCLRQLDLNDLADEQFAAVEKSRAAFAELAIHETALRKTPQDDQLMTKIGSILLEFGDPQEGVLTLLAAVDINPDNRQAHEALLRYYSRQAESDPQAKLNAEHHEKELGRLNRHGQ